jgi:hypothetical protein
MESGRRAFHRSGQRKELVGGLLERLRHTIDLAERAVGVQPKQARSWIVVIPIESVAIREWDDRGRPP